MFSLFCKFLFVFTPLSGRCSPIFFETNPNQKPKACRKIRAREPLTPWPHAALERPRWASWRVGLRVAVQCLLGCVGCWAFLLRSYRGKVQGLRFNSAEIAQMIRMSCVTTCRQHASMRCQRRYDQTERQSNTEYKPGGRQSDLAFEFECTSADECVVHRTKGRASWVLATRASIRATCQSSEKTHGFQGFQSGEPLKQGATTRKGF